MCFLCFPLFVAGVQTSNNNNDTNNKCDSNSNHIDICPACTRFNTNSSRIANASFNAEHFCRSPWNSSSNTTFLIVGTPSTSKVSTCSGLNGTHIFPFHTKTALLARDESTHPKYCCIVNLYQDAHRKDTSTGGSFFC